MNYHTTKMITLKLKKNELGNKVFFGYGEDLDFKCFRCRKEIEEGFICEDRSEFVLCPECQDKFEMHKCRHDKRGEHKHIKFIRGKENGKANKPRTSGRNEKNQVDDKSPADRSGSSL